MTAHTDLELESAGSKNSYSSAELAILDPKKIPQHVAIIMDGNRRWAKQNGLPPMMGHWEGAEGLTDVVRAASDLGIKTLTVYAFSTENWIRPEKEIEALMNIFELYLVRKKEHMVRDGIRLEAIGDLARLPDNVRNALDQTRKATEHCEKIRLVLALNYGGRDEIRRAMVKVLQQYEREKFDPKELTVEQISKYMDTKDWSDPDLLIRTSGELRVSNFLLWQISYAEIYVSDVLWPNFSSKHLLDAVLAYQSRTRRLGGTI